MKGLASTNRASASAWMRRDLRQVLEGAGVKYETGKRIGSGVIRARASRERKALPGRTGGHADWMNSTGHRPYTEPSESGSRIVSKPLVILIGARGTGKSTVGRALAARLGWSFVDADERIESVAGTSIAEIFRSEGEAGFRDRESAVLTELCERNACVIATGGGVVLRAENRERLRSGFVVWLTATPEAAFERMQADPTTAGRRPNLTPAGGLDEMRALMAAREPLYRACADFTLDTANLSPEAAADAILSAWTSS